MPPHGLLVGKACLKKEGKSTGIEFFFWKICRKNYVFVEKASSRTEGWRFSGLYLFIFLQSRKWMKKYLRGGPIERLNSEKNSPPAAAASGVKPASRNTLSGSDAFNGKTL